MSASSWLERCNPDIVQISGRYSLLEQSAQAELLPMCTARGVPVVLGGPYNSGILAGGSHYNYKPADPTSSGEQAESPKSARSMTSIFEQSRSNSAPPTLPYSP